MSTIIAVSCSPEGRAQVVQDGPNTFAFVTDTGKDTLTRDQIIGLAIGILEALATEEEAEEAIDIISSRPT